MAYTINFADPLSTSFTIPDGAYNGPGGNSSSTSMRLYGKGALDWGESVNENLVKLLETFNSATPPTNPVNGQLWMENRLYYRSVSTGTFYRFSYSTNTWVAINVIQSSGAPTAVKGQYWFDTTSGKLYLYHQLFAQQPLSWNNRLYTTGNSAPDPAARPLMTLRVFDSSISDWSSVPVVEISSVTSAPAGSRPGTLRFNPSTGTLMIWTGFAWNSASGGGGGTGSEYILPTATSMILGGVKVGDGLVISSEGTLSVEPITIPTASVTTAGTVKIGTGLDVDVDGTISVTPGGGGGVPYTLPAATTTVLGGVKVGSGLTVSVDGTLDATPTPYTLPTASSTTLGGIKVGSGLSVDGNGALNAAVTTATNATNIGTGVGLYVDKVSEVLRFKSLVAGSNITFTETADGITVDAVQGGTASFGGENIGTGVGLYAGQNGVLVQLKSLIAGANIVVTDGVDEITLEATQPNIQASNLGTGTGIFQGKTGDLLSFKSIRGGSNVTISEADNTLYINATGGGSGSASGSNLGTGTGIYSNATGSTLNFRSLVAGRNVSITSDTNAITIAGVDTIKSIVEFGAIGDGVTDNTAAFAAAVAWILANQKAVYVPPGVYLTSAITLHSSSNADWGGFVGSDAKTTIIQQIGSAAANTALLTIGASSMTSYVSNATFANITFKVNGAATNSAAVRSYDLSNTIFDKCVFQGGDVAFDCKGGLNTSFNSCAFKNSNYGLRITQFSRVGGGWPNHISVNGGNVSANATCGIYFDDGRHLSVNGVHFTANGTTPGTATHAGIYVGTNVGGETGTTTSRVHSGVIVTKSWFDETRGVADIVLNSGFNVINDSLFWSQPNIVTNNIRINSGKYSLTNDTFGHDTFTTSVPNVYEGPGVASGNVIIDSEIPFVTWNSSRTAYAAGVKTYMPELYAINVAQRGGMPIATMQNTLGSSMTKPHTITGYAVSTSSATEVVYFPQAFTDVPVVMVTPVNGGTGVALTPMIGQMTTTYFTVIKRAVTSSGVQDLNYSFVWAATGNLA